MKKEPKQKAAGSGNLGQWLAILTQIPAEIRIFGVALVIVELVLGAIIPFADVETRKPFFPRRNAAAKLRNSSTMFLYRHPSTRFRATPSGLRKDKTFLKLSIVLSKNANFRTSTMPEMPSKGQAAMTSRGKGCSIMYKEFRAGLGNLNRTISGVSV